MAASTPAQVLQQQLRAAQLAGHDIGAIIGQITAAPMDRARSISSVLHGRLQQLAPAGSASRRELGPADTASAPALARELAAGLDERARVLGEHLAASPEPWLARRLGALAPGASPALREEYARRAAAAAAYREAAGITDPLQAVSLHPHRSNPELEDMRLAAIRALEISDEADIIRGMTHGELEARALEAERAQATAPPDVSRQLRLTAQAEAEACSNPQTPPPATIRLRPRTGRHLLTSSPPNARGLRVSTLATSNGPSPPPAQGRQPRKLRPNSSAEASPGSRPDRRSNRSQTSPILI